MAKRERQSIRSLSVVVAGHDERDVADLVGHLEGSSDGPFRVGSLVGRGSLDDAFEPGAADCVVVATPAAGEGPDLRGLLADCSDDTPTVVVLSSEQSAAMDEFVAAGAHDCMAWSTVESHPRLFARRVRTVAAVGHSGSDAVPRNLFEQVPDPVAIIQEGRFVAVNQRTTDLLGADRDRIVGSDVMDIVTGDDEVEVARRFRRLLEGETDQVPYTDRRFVGFDGRERYVRVSSGRTEYRGRPAILITARDVTEERRREQRLLSYETMVETIGDVVYTLDPDYDFTLVAGAAEAVTGYTSEELEGANLSLLLSESDIQRGREYRKEVIEGDLETGSIEVTVHRKDGSTIPVEFRYRRLPSDGAFRGTAGVFRDISERRERERQLRRQNERLEEFAAIVSHDLRNPLNVARGELSLARSAVDNDHLGTVDEALGRMESLIEDTLALARQGQAVSEPEPVDLGSLAEGCWGLVETGSASLRIEDPGRVMGDPDRVRQILENLFRNSIDHAGGWTTGEPGDQEQPGETDQVAVRIGPLPDGEGYYVEDDGPGIPAEDRESVFDPGFSTDSAGSGFGLAIVQTIARAHDWSVTVTESEAGGARFEFAGVDPA